jgi:hypothetical protein
VSKTAKGGALQMVKIVVDMFIAIETAINLNMNF